MYNGLLIVHSYFRWLVLIALLVAIVVGFRGWLGNREFDQRANAIRHWTATVLHVQFALGIALYFISPITTYFLKNFSTAVKESAIRFFGMEHSIVMILSVMVVSAASSIAKRREGDQRKFKIIAIGYSIGLLIILSSIPWPFSPYVARPFFRGF